jgi:hypothetical protein
MRLAMLIPFTIESPGNTQLGIFGKLANQKLKMVLIERNVRIHIAYNFVFQISHSRPPTAAGNALPGKMPFTTLGHPDQFDPWICRGVSAYDIVGAISGTVTYDDPFDRPYRLCNNGFDSQFNELCFVPRGCDEHIARQL